MSEQPHSKAASEPQAGDVVTDDDGSEWRIVANFSNGLSRVRVGSLAESIHFPEDAKQPA